MALTARTVAALVALALAALVLPGAAIAVAGAVLAGLTLADALLARRAPRVRRTLPRVLSRGVGVPLRIALEGDDAGPTRIRQPLVPDLALADQEATGRVLATTLTPRRRGRHTLPAVALRTRGPLGLGAWQHRAAGDLELTVYPDLPSARRLALAVREGRFRDPGVRTRGPVGLGTEFERVRDYLPDDDIRQVNWRATARLGRPMSNQHRVEQDQEIVIVLDVGRLMAAPLRDRTRCDEALDAATALALVADELGDRCGAIAFDDAVRRRVRPGRASGADVVRATFDLEPSERDADYELAFRTIGGGKRALVVVLTDLLDAAAARALVDAVPVLTRRHAVLVASARDPDVAAMAQDPTDPYVNVAARDLLAARTQAAAAVRGAGAQVVEADPGQLGAACVRAYLYAKSRRRL
ncbi:hypothetical protein DSM104299_00360 [Baekduia alba]|uniref:DUF58 domain-containing protein n=1 Tax=Baekduia alba TaxID=2997333 RepID=UPI00234189B4|nr:DUF58 domain-containing protein [Baekduia alba]WCB91687.1 hypothetical protein DSM104299_00360 [Baekduia alba]